MIMIANDQELNVTPERIAKFQRQVSHLRNVETNPANYYGSACSGAGTSILIMENPHPAR